MQKKLSQQLGIASLFVFFAAFSRLLPHWPNFTPVGGMALFGAAYFSRKYISMLIPFLALWLSDLILNNVVYGSYYDSFQWWGHTGVYLGFALISVLAVPMLRSVTAGKLISASLSASLLFFLVSNFFEWVSTGMYEKSWAGLLSCYTAGLPFFWNTLAGDLFFTAVLFGGFAVVIRSLSLSTN